MSMYDTMGTEQVKAFPWYSYDQNASISNNLILSHGGGLRAWKAGDEVPYRSASYNYEKDFAIVDLHPSMASDNPDWLVHIIKDGKYVKTFTPEDYNAEDEDMLSNSNKVIGIYGGTPIKISSIDDIINYKKEAAKTASQADEIANKRSSLLRQLRASVNKLHDISDRSSKEYLDILDIIEENSRLSKEYDKEYERAKPRIDALYSEFNKKWLCDISDSEKRYSVFGKWIEAGLILLDEVKRHEKDSEKEIQEAKTGGWYIDYENLFAKYSNDFLERFKQYLVKNFMDEYFQCMDIPGAGQMEIYDLLNAVAETKRK